MNEVKGSTREKTVDERRMTAEDLTIFVAVEIRSASHTDSFDRDATSTHGDMNSRKRKEWKE